MNEPNLNVTLQPSPDEVIDRLAVSELISLPWLHDAMHGDVPALPMLVRSAFPGDDTRAREVTRRMRELSEDPDRLETLRHQLFNTTE